MPLRKKKNNRWRGSRERFCTAFLLQQGSGLDKQHRAVTRVQMDRRSNVVMTNSNDALTDGEECDEKPLWKQTLCAQLHWSCRRIRSELSVRLKVLFTLT